MNDSIQVVFIIDIFVLFVLLIGALWSVAFPEKRTWPPPEKRSWQHALTWACFCIAFLCNAALIILDWNSWVMKDEVRLLLGIPLAIIGALLVSWGVATLGVSNSSGLKGGFVLDGSYRYTRNPQYLGDMLLFIGLSLITNSLFLWITHVLIILVFMITPLAEEVWLEEQYGEEYREYKRGTSRFL